MAERGPTIQIPRWVQLVGLPVLLVLAWAMAGTLGHVLFLFLTAALIAFLLNPLVRDLQRIRIPRGIGVAIVYLSFAAAIIVAVVALATVVVAQVRSASDRADTYLTEKHGQSGKTDAERDVDRLQHWLDTHRLKSVRIRKQATDWLDSVQAKDVSKYTGEIVDFVRGAAISLVSLLFSLVLVIVISIYMLLDMPRLERSIDRRFPPHGGAPLTLRIEAALAGYVKGQILLSAIIGASAGGGMWALGATGLVPGADRYALLFGVWTALIEVIPYVGPWLSAVPPAVYALVVHPISIVWVAALFAFIYQIEGHVVVPNVMASALRLHPLLVIFGLLAGGAIYGLPGILLALPLMAAIRAIWEFFAERVSLEPWVGAGPVPVEVELEAPPPLLPVSPPEDSPRAASR
jgi:predicted PurR-regulated permease PerM